MSVKIGVDASNLLQGGGRTHLIELLNATLEQNFDYELFVWGKDETLSLLPDSSSIHKVSNNYLEGGFFSRFFWQTFLFKQELEKYGCEVLFVPGGNYLGRFTPFITMSRNMLPFEFKELRRYYPSKTFFKLLFLRFTQLISFARADGVIFLSDYAKDAILKIKSIDTYSVVPHGISRRFDCPPKEQRSIDLYDSKTMYQLVYVSTIDFYKHQWHLVEAVGSLREKHNWPLKLTLCGPANKNAEPRLTQAISKYDPDGVWVEYKGAIPYSELSSIYQESDLAVFPSSCENMPNTLVEYMVAGLPIACSHSGPMGEVLGNTGLYFDPEDPQQIEKCLEEMIADESLRSELVSRSYERSKSFSWLVCAKSTFEFIRSCIR